MASFKVWTQVLLLIGSTRLVAAPVPEVGEVLKSAFTQRAAPVDVATLDAQLLGVIVDGSETGMELVYRDGESFYLPVEVLSWIGVRGENRGNRLYLTTPGGQVEADPGLFPEIGGRSYFSSRLLHEVLKIGWEFAPEQYAVSMTLPWWQVGLPQETFAGPDARVVDVAPSGFGLTQVRLDNTWFSDRRDDFYQSNLLLRGRLADGIWRGEVVAQENREVMARDYYWLKDHAHVQTLIGNQEVLINPLLPSVETTGAQALVSSRPLAFDPYHDQTRSQYVRRFGISTREIEGLAQPGTIAELRVDDRPVARVRVNLDGTYRFDEVKSNTLQFRTVRVHILDQRSFVELEVQDFTRTPIDLLLEGRQTVLFGGLGAAGNPLDPLDHTDGQALFGLLRYGLTDRMTVEAGAQSADGRTYQTVGMSASMGRNWATGLSVASHEGSQGYSLDLYGRADRWQVTLRSQVFDSGFRTRMSPDAAFHELRYEHWLSRRLSVGLEGGSRKLDEDSDDYLLPGLTWRFGRRNYAKVWPDVNGDYRVDVRTVHRRRDWFEFVHDGMGDRAEYRYYRSPKLEYFGRVARSEDADLTLGELGAIFYPNEYDDRSLLAASVFAADGGAGYRFAWQTTVLPGLFSLLEIRDEPVGSEYYDPGLQVRWTLSVDLAFSDGRPVPARNDFTQGRLGSIAGRLTLPDGSPLDQGVDKVSILIDGKPHTAVLRGRYFFVRGIVPGIYDVSLGSEYLPMSISPQALSYRVKVVSAATSTVEFVVQHEYGMSGRAIDGEGRGVGGLRLECRGGDGSLSGSAYSDAYGYYRFAGLVPGSYRVSVADARIDAAPIEVEIVDGFLFDVDLTLP